MSKKNPAENAIKNERFIENLENYFQLDNKNRITKASRSFAHKLGYKSAAECIGLSFKKQFIYEQVQYSKFIKTLYDKGSISGYELVLRHKNGSQVVVAVNCHVVFTDQGKPAWLEGTFIDISTYKKTEQILKEKSDLLKTLTERYEFILEATKTDIDIISENFDLAYVDKRWRKKYGNPAGRKCYEYFMGRKSPCPTCGIPTAFKTKRVAVSEEILPHENNRAIRVHTIPFRDKDGKWKVAEFNIDITDLKKTAEALRESEAKFRSLVEHSPAGIFLMTEKFKFTYFNDKMCEIFGYTREEFATADTRKLLAPESYNLVIERYLQRQTGKKVPERYEFQIIRKDGERRDVEMIATTIEDNEGLTNSLGQIFDITERKQIENALITREESLRSFINNSLLGVSIINEKGKIIEWNQAAEKISGIPRSQAIGEYFWDIVTEINPGERRTNSSKKQIIDAIKHGLKTGKPLSKTLFELEIIDSNGKKKIIQQFIFPIKTNLGSRFGALMQDITDQKRSEIALRESETKFRTLVENSPMGIFLLNDNYKFTYANDELCKITGYKLDEITGSDFRNFISAKSLKLVSERYKKRQNGEVIPHHYDIQIVRRDGELRDLELNVTSIKDHTGKPQTIGQVSDITEKKLIDNTLKEREESLRTFIDNSLMGVVIIDENGRVIEWNQSIEKLSGISKDEAIEQDSWDILMDLSVTANNAKNRKNRIEKMIQHGLKTGIPPSDTMSKLEIINKRGEKITAQQLVFPIKTIKGYRFGIMLQDITSRKKAEDALKESETKFRTLVEHSPAGIFLVGDDFKFSYINEEMRNILGYEPEEIIGMDFRSILTPQSVRLVSDRYIRRQKGEKVPSRYEFQIIKKNGEIRDVELISTAIQDQTGKSQTLGQVYDITEKKRIENTLAEREESLRSFIEHSIIGVMIINEEGRITEWNKALEKLSGIPKAEAIDQNWWKLLITMFPEKKEIEGRKHIIKKSILDSLKSGHPVPNKLTEWEIVNRNGNRIIAEQLIFPVKTNKGYRFGVFTQDITDRKMAEEALRESEERLLLAKNSSKTGMWDYDVENNRLIWDEQMYEIYGIKHSEFDNEYLTWEGSVHKDDLERARGDVQDALQNQRDFHSEFRIVKPDGSIRTIEAHAIVQRSQSGAPLHMIGTNQDITDRKMVEAERLELERKFLHSQKLESLGILAGGIAHDFNNLLTAIVGNLDLALMNIPIQSASSENIKKAIQAARRATDLTQQMLAYSGKGSFILEPININEIITDNVNLFRASIAKNVILKLEKSDDVPLIKADPGQVQQVVMNLITNASEAIGDSNGVVTLRTGTMECSDAYLSQSRLDEKPKAGKFVFLEVSDTGKGMDWETSQRLFDPFFTTKFAGRGLGLSAVLGIMRGHKGAIIIDSEIKRGTAFRVLFPLGESMETTIARTYTAAIPEHIPSTINGTVLIVDDEETVRKTTMEFLAYLGLKTFEAADGEIACEIFLEKKDEIDCVILDLTMPKMDGLMTYNEMKMMKPEQKVILCSGYSEKEATSRFNGHGLSAFLQKPYRLQELKNILVRVLS